MTPAELRRNAAQADAQGAHALAERLRTRAAGLEEKPSPNIATMTTASLEELAAAVGAELARRGGGRGPTAKPHQEAGIPPERGGREK